MFKKDCVHRYEPSKPWDEENLKYWIDDTNDLKSISDAIVKHFYDKEHIVSYFIRTFQDFEKYIYYIQQKASRKCLNSPQEEKKSVYKEWSLSENDGAIILLFLSWLEGLKQILEISCNYHMLLECYPEKHIPVTYVEEDLWYRICHFINILNPILKKYNLQLKETSHTKIELIEISK